MFLQRKLDNILHSYKKTQHKLKSLLAECDVDINQKKKLIETTEKKIVTTNNIKDKVVKSLTSVNTILGE